MPPKKLARGQLAYGCDTVEELDACIARALEMDATLFDESILDEAKKRGLKVFMNEQVLYADVIYFRKFLSRRKHRREMAGDTLQQLLEVCECEYIVDNRIRVEAIEAVGYVVADWTSEDHCIVKHYGICSVFVNVLKKADDPGVLFRAVRCVGNIALLGQTTRDELLKLGVGEALLAIFQNLQKVDSNINKAAQASPSDLLAAVTYAARSISIYRIADLGLVQAIAKLCVGVVVDAAKPVLLGSLRISAKAVAYALRSLSRTTDERDGIVMAFVIESGGAPLFQALKQHLLSQDDECAEDAIRFVYYISSRNNHLDTAIDSGILHCFPQVLKNSGSDIRYYCLHALTNMLKNPDHVQAVLDVDELWETVINCLEQCKRHDVRKAVVSCIANAARCARLNSFDALMEGDVFGSLDQHIFQDDNMTDPKGTVAALRAIEELVLAGETVKVALDHKRNLYGQFIRTHHMSLYARLQQFAQSDNAVIKSVAERVVERLRFDDYRFLEEN